MYRIKDPKVGFMQLREPKQCTAAALGTMLGMLVDKCAP